ncbi:3-hydroxyisobutyrate dehydrogenase [Mycobacterium europaeum]|uniref:3-hydroxyisobutyrate dehydrogenase n=1 Tax=Mycobacterium europaeum TaxID=761804 RepID=A0A0U1D1D0_9MYCO|nr:3-hydroxyisobutyrate dehydrogenase [Mycobacterium europaeum]
MDQRRRGVYRVTAGMARGLLGSRIRRQVLQPLSALFDAAAEELQSPPVARLLRDRFLTLVATGGGQLDWSALATLADWDAGLASDHSA